MKVVIEFIEEQTENVWSGWKVTYGDRYAYGLCYEEMLGLIAAITMPETRRCLSWLKTEEQHNKWRDDLLAIAKRNSEPAKPLLLTQ